MKIIGLGILGLALCAACGRQDTSPANGPASEPVASLAAVQTAGVANGAPVNAGFLATPATDGLVLAAAGIAGIEFYSADGSRAGRNGDIEAGLLAVLPDVALGGAGAPLIVVYDSARAVLAGYRLEHESLTLEPVMAEPLAVNDEIVGLCHYRSRLAGRDYLYAVTDGGLIHHYELYEQDGGLAGRLLRTIPSGKGSGFCAVDPRDAMLYVSEESNGVWRLGAEPERDTTREPLDLRAPFGSLSDDIKGVAVYPVNAQLSYLVVADVGAAGLVVYRLPEGDRLGHVTVTGLLEPEGLAATAAAFGADYPDGLVAIADEGDTAGNPNLKLVDWRELVRAAGLDAGAGAVAAAEAPVVVRPSRQTDVMPTFGDAADDPAIWVHPDDPALSLVIGTNKKSGLHVFDLDGNTLQVVSDGRMNNVDLRDGFPLGGEPVTLVTASNRSNDSIAAYRIDVATRRLVDVADGVLDTGFADPYGTCMYHDTTSDDFYVFVNENADGTIRQWRLFDNGSGRVSVEQVREFTVGSQAEGCVADDETGALYVAEEDVGLWKYAAGADGGSARTKIDGVGEAGRLTDDVEGVTLVTGEAGSGFLVVSNQGADNYAVYRREGDNAWVGMFHVVANAADGIDGASETDGLDATGKALGSRFPAGLLVVQDGRNIAPEQPQNFKYVSWADVLDALGVD